MPVPGGGCCCNKHLQVWTWLWDGLIGKGWSNVEEFDRKSRHFLEQTVSRTLDIKGTAAVGSEENEEHVTGNWRKENLCYIVAESLAHLFL